MDQAKYHLTRLYNTSIVDNKKDEIEERYERSYVGLQSLTSGLSEKDVHDALNSTVAKDKGHEDVCLGLLSVILTEPQNASKSYRDLTLVSRDGLATVQLHLSQLILEKWGKLTDGVRTQLLWLVKEMIRNGVNGVENICWNLMRHMAGGDLSTKNVFLIENILDILIENRTWLEKFPLIIAISVYTFLRLIEDHTSPAFANLQKKEIAFTIALLRERFTDCLMIGRDLVRLLQNVARIPEFDNFWRDLLHNPKSLSPTFGGVLSIMQTRTSRRFLQSRLTPDMEQKLVFLTSNVRFGNHKRYQEWFQRQYLGTPEAQTLRCDLIRFIVGVIHPTNELLCSDIIPRWAVIGWLLTTCTSTIAATNAKLALFYDWLFYDPEKDNIMNIEPAILVMHHSMRSHPAVTATLLDFLCRIIPNFYPALADKVKTGIYTSLRQILEKRVLSGLYALFDSPKLDRELRVLIHDTFPEFCFPPPVEGNRIDEIRDDEMDCGGPPDIGNHNGNQQEAVFSDEEGEKESAVKQEKESTTKGKSKSKKKEVVEEPKVKVEENPEPPDEKADMYKNLEGDLKKAVLDLNCETDNEARCEIMEKLVQLVIQDEDIEDDVLVALASCLCEILHNQLEGKVFPETVSPETLEDSIGKPLFVLLRNLVELAECDHRRNPICSLLVEIHVFQPRVGYLLMYYINASSAADETENSRNDKMQGYREFCEQLDKKLEDCIYDDLKLCQEDDVQLLCWLAPSVYNEFPNIAIGHANLLHLIVSSVDARQLQELVCRIVQGSLVMLQDDILQHILTSSLMWETFEQVCLWQIVSAHSISISSIIPVLTKLDFASHAEALTAILLMLQQEKPTAELVKQVLSRDVGPHCDLFVVSVLLSWCREHEGVLSELIASLLSSRCPAVASPNKRKRAGTRASAAPSAERILGHLDRLRTGTKQLYKFDAMQKALQQAQSACTDTQKSQFSNLFALVEVEETGRGKGGGRGRRPANSMAKKKIAKDITSDSTDESSEDEEIIKPRQAKKRKKNPVGSDSD
ncbi:integrator complex subunit 3 [Cimex lectularius]|uniref:SOSS complex subunit A homolog n=1 Tax=Cimex lectularius TaxID=79782 RepID=A0A8I6RGA5_CIMLE|nr:integrator complex subunit 3 [Cimex lectularius]